MKMNDKIDFITAEIITNENGFTEEKESIYYNCWCNAKVLSFKEFYSNYTKNNKVVISFRCRMCNKLKDIDSLSYKIKYKGKLYNIIYIVPAEGNDFIDIKGEVVNV